MGQPAGQALSLTDAVPFAEFEEMPLADALTLAYVRRKDLRGLEVAAGSGAEGAESRKRYEYVPTLGVGGFYGVLGETTGLYHGVFAAEGRLSVPVFQEGTLRGQREVAAAQVIALAESGGEGQQGFDRGRDPLVDAGCGVRRGSWCGWRGRTWGWRAQELNDATLRFTAGVDDNLPVVRAQAALEGAQTRVIQAEFEYNYAKLHAGPQHGRGGRRSTSGTWAGSSLLEQLSGWYGAGTEQIPAGWKAKEDSPLYFHPAGICFSLSCSLTAKECSLNLLALAFGLLVAGAGLGFGLAGLGFAGAGGAGVVGFGPGFAQAAGCLALWGFAGDQRELQAARGAVDAVEQNVHALAELKHLAGVRADDSPVGFAEEEVVDGAEGERGRKRLNGDEAFDEELVELDEEAVLGAGEDGRVEVLADAVLHELDLFPLHQLALGIVGAALGLRGLERDGGEFF